MIGTMRTQRILLAGLALVLLAACGRSHVTREPAHARGGRVPAGERPVRVSQPKYGATVVVQRGHRRGLLPRP